MYGDYYFSAAQRVTGDTIMQMQKSKASFLQMGIAENNQSCTLPGVCLNKNEDKQQKGIWQQRSWGQLKEQYTSKALIIIITTIKYCILMAGQELQHKEG
jgi:hypothetical protein